MSIVNSHLAFVNEQISFQDKQIAKYSDGKFKSDHRVKLHTATRDKFKELLAALIVADQELDANAKRTKKGAASFQPNLMPEELEGLPKELLNELSISEGDKTEFAIVGLINDAGGILSMDRILIGLFKKTNEVFRRNTMTSKLYRMSQKGLIYSVPNKKGWYSVEELTAEEVDKLFDQKSNAIQSIMDLSVDLAG